MTTDFQKRQRKYLDMYTDAMRQMELAGAAIGILEGMNTRASMGAVHALERDQQRLLKKLDAAATKLGAPYPG